MPDITVEVASNPSITVETANVPVITVDVESPPEFTFDFGGQGLPGATDAAGVTYEPATPSDWDNFGLPDHVDGGLDFLAAGAASIIDALRLKLGGLAAGPVVAVDGFVDGSALTTPVDLSGGDVDLIITTGGVNKKLAYVLVVDTGNTLTVTCDTGLHFDLPTGATSVTLTELDESILFQFDPDNDVWLILAHSKPSAATTGDVVAEAASRVAGDAASVSTASADATSKVAAEAALRVTGDATSVSTAAADATSKVAAEAALRVTGDATSVSTAAADATAKVATETAARTAADALLIPLTQKAAASGVASLDGSTKVPITQLPTGTSSSTVALGDAAGTVQTNLTNHLGDTSDAHDASAISVVPAGSIASTDVQAALAELDAEKIDPSTLPDGGAAVGATKLIGADGTLYTVTKVMAGGAPLVASTGTFSGAVAMGANKITGLADAAAATDAMNRQSGDARWAQLSGYTMAGNITLAAGNNLILSTSGAGTQIGTGSTQLLGFYGATAIVRPSSTTDLRTALINLGLYTTGGATPLDLNGGALSTSGTASFTGGVVTEGDGTAGHGKVTLASTAFGSGVNVYLNSGDANPAAGLFSNSVFLGAGGATAADWNIAHSATSTATLTGDIATGTSTGSRFGTGATQKLGFWGATAVARASAYTQTFATATRTHAARTTAAVTDSTGGTKGTTLAAVTGAVYATDIPTIRTWAASIMDQVTKTQADLANTAQLLNQVIDDLQLYGVLA